MCDTNQIYSAYLFIKIVNETEIEKNEKYYSFSILDFSTNKTFFEENKNYIILIIFGIVIIIILIFAYLCWRRMKKKNTNLEEKFRVISFSEGIEEVSSNLSVSEKSKSDEEYENTFI